jgi:hypothetical protein
MLGFKWWGLDILTGSGAHTLAQTGCPVGPKITLLLELEAHTPRENLCKALISISLMVGGEGGEEGMGWTLFFFYLLAICSSSFVNCLLFIAEEPALEAAHLVIWFFFLCYQPEKSMYNLRQAPYCPQNLDKIPSTSKEQGEMGSGHTVKSDSHRLWLA